MNDRDHGRPRVRPSRDELGSESKLRSVLRRLEGAPFPSYRQLTGRHAVGEFVLSVDRIPPDPFAGPAKLRLIVSRDTAGADTALLATRAGRVAVEDWLARRASSTLARLSGRGSVAAQSRHPVRLQEIGAAVIERSACRVGARSIELRLLVDLPARGRRILGRQAEELLVSEISRLGTACLLFSARANSEARRAVDNVEDHHSIQAQLRDRGLVAFVAEGSLLARESGAGGDADLPRRDGLEVAFEAPESLAVDLQLPHAGRVRGLGIPAGVTLIVGGAFHGKSTLIDAIARAVHPHRSGDGRERVATVPEAVTVRAEDGRATREVDITAFLGELPSGAVAGCFTTDKASGSTSQAAAIVEAVEIGARVLLLDEDRCATNFMVRDGRMQRLVPKPDEPITPFLDRVRELYENFGVSTILVTGGSGDYLEVAHTVIRMKDYRAQDATREAREVAAATRSMRLEESRKPMVVPRPRMPRFDAVRSRDRAVRFGPRGPRGIRVGTETVELGVLQQIVESGQTRALAQSLRHLSQAAGVAPRALRELVEAHDAWLDDGGLDRMDHPVAFDLSRPRRFELAAALNRWRALSWSVAEDESS